VAVLGVHDQQLSGGRADREVAAGGIGGGVLRQGVPGVHTQPNTSGRGVDDE
jgi:hypothetical protein